MRPLRASVRWALLSLLAFLGLSLAPARAQADEALDALPQRPASLTLDQGLLRLSLSYRDVVDAPTGKRLQSGLPTVIVYRGMLVPARGGTPLALVVRSCRVVYDLWDEIFHIQVLQTGQGAIDTVAVNLEGVLRQCAELRSAALLEPSVLGARRAYVVASLVEVNPLGPELLDRIQRWVARPGGEARISSADSLLASFVGLFVPRVGDADRKLAFRSPAFAPEHPESAALAR